MVRGKSSNPGVVLETYSGVANAGLVARLQVALSEARQAPGCLAIKFACQSLAEVCCYALPG
jgi:hypothetical protein